MTIKLNNPKEIITTPEVKKTLTQLTIQRVVDNPNNKIVRAFVNEVNQPITLWEGKDYDSIGQWQDSDVQKRLQQLYS